MATPYLSLLEALRAHCNLPAFPDPIPSNQLVLELQGGPSITIDLNEEASMVVLFSEIGAYDPQDELDILSKIAQANFLWAATSGGTLSARPEIRTVYLAYQIPVTSLEGEEFIDLVEKFVAVAKQWETIVKKTESGNEGEVADASAAAISPEVAPGAALKHDVTNNA